MADPPPTPAAIAALAEQLVAALRALSPDDRARLAHAVEADASSLGLSEAGKAALHRALAQPGQIAVLQWREFRLDLNSYRVEIGGQLIELSHREFELLRYFIERPGRAISRERLLQEVWGLDYFGSTKTVDVHMYRLRRKLGKEYRACLQTVRHIGYRLGA